MKPTLINNIAMFLGLKPREVHVVHVVVPFPVAEGTDMIEAFRALNPMHKPETLH